jgi:Outer membrane protein and related peptidoglycan-associated (lipo)proteins
MGVVAVCGLAAGPAAAVTTDGYDIPYVGALGQFQIPDGARDSSNGYGARLLFGYPLKPFHLKHSALELSIWGLQRKRDIDGKHDYQQGVFLDYVHDFGLFGWPAQYGAPRFKPFLLGGAGAIREDVRGTRSYHPGVDVGGGAIVPLPFWGASVRAEARVIGQQNSTTVPGNDFLVDYSFGLGFEIPLTPFFPTSLPAQPAPEPPAQPVKVVPLARGNSCSTDTDGDGVPDCRDQCPGTPAGMAVDSHGCPTGAMKSEQSSSASSQQLSLPLIQFASNSAKLSDNAQSELKSLANGLSSHPNTRLQIDGFTDSSGNETMNRRLSQQRAIAVRDFLVAHGVATARMVVLGKDSAHPIASNSSAAGRAANRRVQFEVLSSGNGSSAAPAAAPSGPTANDSDGDGVPNDKDQCPGTPAGMVVDSHGCPTGAMKTGNSTAPTGAAEVGGGSAASTPAAAPATPTASADSDGDGVPNDKDQCPGTPSSMVVDSHGCPTGAMKPGNSTAPTGAAQPDNTSSSGSASTSTAPASAESSKDSDGDGVPDDQDKCPGTPPGIAVDSQGCPSGN